MFREVLSIPQLAAASANNIAQSQDPSGAGNLTLNGSAVSGGVATLDNARRVGITSASDDSALTFTITGTDRYGRAQTEIVTGASGTPSTVAESKKDFLTVSNVAVSGNSGAVTVGTTAKASSKPHICETFSTGHYSYSLDQAATAVPMVEISYDNLAPAWDIAGNNVTWKEYGDDAHSRILETPCMIRLVNKSGVGAVSLTLIPPYVAGAV